MQKWEYLSLNMDKGPLTGGEWKVRHLNGQEINGWRDGPMPIEFYNELGDEGWELVSEHYGNDTGNNNHPYYHAKFKRPKA